jgi:hypothetical protein
MSPENFARMRGLQAAYTSSPLDIPDIARQLDGKLKRVQFDTLPQFSEALDNICGLLDTTRREFLERAMMDAIGRAEAAFLAAYKDATGQDYGDSSVTAHIPEA